MDSAIYFLTHYISLSSLFQQLFLEQVRNLHILDSIIVSHLLDQKFITNIISNTLLIFPGELWVVILKGPFEVVVGVVYGLVLGILCWVLPVPTEHNAPVLRFVVLLAAGIVSLFGSPLVRSRSSFNSLVLNDCHSLNLDLQFFMMWVCDGVG